MTNENKAQENIPSVDELVLRLKRENATPSVYMGGFYLTKAKLLKKYEERIREDAIDLQAELKRKATAKAKSEATEKSEQQQFLTTQNLEIQNAARKIKEFDPEIDYVDLSADDRKTFEKLSETIARKPLDEWSLDEKIIYKFWHRLPRYGLVDHKIDNNVVSGNEIRAFMNGVKSSQQEQISALTGLKWIVVAFIVTFFIKFIWHL